MFDDFEGLSSSRLTDHENALVAAHYQRAAPLLAGGAVGRGACRKAEVREWTAHPSVPANAVGRDFSTDRTEKRRSVPGCWHIDVGH